jgi:hypothetical protein
MIKVVMRLDNCVDGVEWDVGCGELVCDVVLDFECGCFLLFDLIEDCDFLNISAYAFICKHRGTDTHLLGAVSPSILS